MDGSFLKILVADIQREYERLGHDRGWRFLTSAAKTLAPTTESVFVTLNPGGDHAPADHPSESCENGSAYLVETWGDQPPGGHKLQVQVQALFKALRWGFDTTLSGQLVPFRSRSWDSLPRRAESLGFGKDLWARVIDYVRPSVVVVMGKSQLRAPFCEILGRPRESRDLLVNWGAISAGIDWFDNCVLLSLPHLSRFGLMTRNESRSAIASLAALAAERR